MPGFFGILRLNGRKFPTVEKARIETSFVFEPNELNIEFWFDGSIGFGWQDQSAESCFPPTPASAGDLSIIADACLTNRTELFKEFGVLPSEQTIFPDDKLILSAFEKWGEDCVLHLNGDFTFAIWDKRSEKLFCARDHMGGSKFFYYIDKEKFVFAGTPGGVLRFKGVEKAFNKNKLAIFLLPEPHTLTSDQSWFKNILPLAAGTVLTVDARGLKTRKYWQPEPVEPLPYKNNDEILEAFRELMFQIMTERTKSRDPVTCLLSGGLDSSSIAAVAAKVLESQGREINFLSAVLDRADDPHFTDEREYIDQFKSFPNVRITYVSAPGKGPFTDLESFFSHYDSPVISSRHYLYTAFVDEARQVGSKTIFEGDFGETGPTFFGEGCFAEMFGRLNWRTLWRELRLRNRFYGQSIVYNFRADALNPWLPDFLVRLKHRDFQKENRLNNLHPLRQNLFESLAAETDFPENPYSRLSPDHRINQFRDIAFLHQKNSETPSATFGKEPVEYRQPFLDKRLLEFCLAVPLELKVRDGYSRYLVRAGLDGILPPKIQWRTSKSPFSPDYMRRYAAQIGRVRQMLADIRPNDPIREVLDIDRISGWADSSAKLSKSLAEYDKIAFNTVPEAIYLICFLRRFSEFRS